MAERLNCSPASLQMLKNDLSAAAGKYLTVEADEISVTITQTTPVILTAKIPLKRNEEYHVRRYKLKNYNFRLVILLIAISIIGVLLIGSADSADQKKQAIGVVLGVVIMIIVSLLDYSWLLNFYWVLLHRKSDDAWRSLSRRFYRKKHVWCDPLDSDRKLSVFSRPSCQKSF